MVVAALLSAVHVLTLGLGLGSVYMRGRALAGRLDEEGWIGLVVTIVFAAAFMARGAWLF